MGVGGCMSFIIACDDNICDISPPSEKLLLLSSKLSHIALVGLGWSKLSKV